MHKKIIALLLSLSLVISATGCTSSKAPETGEASSQETQVESTEQVDEVSVSEDVWYPYDKDGNFKRGERDGNGENGVVSSANYFASKIGTDILEAGGNAIDAAVAVAFGISAVESYYSGIGGGGFMTVRFAETGETKFIDFRETAASAATPENWPKDESGNYTYIGGYTVGVPGEVKGLLYALETYGTMDRQTIMAPAIELARDGFPVGPFFKKATGDWYDYYGYQPETAETYYKNGLPYEVGDIYTNEKLAHSLERISNEGESAFYTGEIAQAIVDSVNADGGVMSLEDLANYEVKVREPIVGSYRGYEIISSPPSSSGGTTIVEILNILENFDVGALEVNSPEYIHLLSEAFKIAYSDRGEYMADTDFVDVPLEGLTSKEYASERAKEIDLSVSQSYTSGDPYIYHSTNTSHISIMDKEGNMVSLTKSNNGGSGVMAKGTGILLNSECGDFATGSGLANSIDGNKRPLSSMSPTLVLKDGKPVMSVGSPGGTRIITTVAQVISHVIDHDMDVQEAIDAPRFFDGYEELKLEGRIPEAVSDELAEMGHKITRTLDWDDYYGGVHAVIMLEDGTLRGGADPRRDGKALGY
ncbi:MULTISPECIES: gamma-glutamyltransferase [unclassified Fusibacter]|uniref:gamma-glutamyltransferase n=1 Tax=unclassified Fusibacter TaxID=2624464 RepID=UPI0010128819|nr:MULTISPECIES: gamma-glutamyltransferase [unclassified Fusibacter]MCK8061070.1 gamma-glutamyltransferase [Fusibacter sp. A2]NPE20476.1 gamma-glutamyltransferase [Fusibacter sp. A1]RXV63680.1 gamma-glutamyltransferase [Fusibacter sp. A1]